MLNWVTNINDQTNSEESELVLVVFTLCIVLCFSNKSLHSLKKYIYIYIYIYIYFNMSIYEGEGDLN
jgi:hypothetical protein